MSRLNEELKIRISPEDKERIKAKMEDAGILNMSAYIRKMALDGICVRPDLEDVYFWTSCRAQAPSLSAKQRASVFGNRTRSQPRHGAVQGVWGLPQQAATEVSGNAGNLSCESLSAQRHCLPKSLAYIQRLFLSKNWR